MVLSCSLGELWGGVLALSVECGESHLGPGMTPLTLKPLLVTLGS